MFAIYATHIGNHPKTQVNRFGVHMFVKQWFQSVSGITLVAPTAMQWLWLNIHIKSGLCTVGWDGVVTMTISLGDESKPIRSCRFRLLMAKHIRFREVESRHV